MEKRRRGRDDNTVLTKDISGLLTKIQSGLEVGFPDVATRDNTKGEDEVGGLHGSNDLVELAGSTVKVDVETSDRQLGSEGNV